MNRRDALKALTALPAVTSVAVADVRKDDVLVVQCDTFVSAETAWIIKQRLAEIWPSNRIVVFDKSMKLTVHRSDKGAISTT